MSLFSSISKNIFIGYIHGEKYNFFKRILIYNKKKNEYILVIIL